jgi:hypothetical protein
MGSPLAVIAAGYSMITPDYEFQRHVGCALAFSGSRKWPKVIALFGEFVALASVVVVLGKAIEFATKFV